MAKYQYSYSGSSPYRGSRSGVPKWIFIVIAMVIVGGAISILLWLGDDIDTGDEIQEEEVVAENVETEPATNAEVKKPTNIIQKQSNPSHLNMCKEAELLFAQDDFPSASKLAEQILSEIDENDKLWERVSIVLSKANTKILLTDVPSPRKKIYTVVSGDSLSKIAHKFNTTIEAIQDGNGLSKSSSIINIGQSFSIYKGEWNIKVSKSRYRLYLYDGEKLFKVYKVGIGIQNRTPVGNFVVSVKQKEPDWYDRKNRVKYKYGDPQNVLGTRWMSLKPIEGTDTGLTGYGIHGTADPSSVGKNSSKGCMRMLNEEVDELYSIIPLRTKVTIIE